VYNVGIRMSENESIVQFKYDSSIIIYNPDINAVTETVRVLNKNDDVEFIEEDEENNLINMYSKIKNSHFST